jgi:hypothetical protein
LQYFLAVAAKQGKPQADDKADDSGKEDELPAGKQIRKYLGKFNQLVQLEFQQKLLHSFVFLVGKADGCRSHAEFPLENCL